jgi:Skp family chaperone for outer membrane proteins
MRRAILVLTGALLMATSSGAFAQQAPAEKDECLLASQNCKDQVDDIYKRMQRLDREIQKGTRVYSTQELERLRQKLAETQDTLRSLEKPGK